MTCDPAVYFDRGCGRCARFDTPDCSALRHAPALALLRALCRGAGLAETAKWGHPCYTHAGRNVALLGAVRAGVTLSLFDAARLDDPAGLMAPAGPNSRVADTIRLASAAEVRARTVDLGALLAQARAVATLGPAPHRPAAAPPDLPPDLAAALTADPALAAAFAALTVGRQRGHAIAVAAARTPATRAARIARLRAALLADRRPDGL